MKIFNKEIEEARIERDQQLYVDATLLEKKTAETFLQIAITAIEYFADSKMHDEIKMIRQRAEIYEKQIKNNQGKM